MPHLGEIISLAVAVLWTATALFADQASRRIGAMSTNIFRLAKTVYTRSDEQHINYFETKEEKEPQDDPEDTTGK